MPRKGYSTLTMTVPDSLYHRLKKRAEDEDRSISNMGAQLLKQALGDKEEQASMQEQGDQLHELEGLER